MSRIEPVADSQAGLGVRVGFRCTRRALTKLTGRTPVRGPDPLRRYARNPRLMRGYAGLEQATASLTRLPLRLRALAELRAATLIGCPCCIDVGSQAARRWGRADGELMALPHYRGDPLVDCRDRLVLDYATAMTQTPAEVPDNLVCGLGDELDADQILELTHVVALENLRGRFNRALGIESAGFSDGAACAVPVSARNDGAA